MDSLNSDPTPRSGAWTQAAQGFAAMGSQSRLQLLRALIRAGAEGASVGALQERTGMAASTLAHHLKTLTDAGLIEQERVGRTTVNRARYDILEALAAFILHECCADDKGQDNQRQAANDG